MNKKFRSMALPDQDILDMLKDVRSAVVETYDGERVAELLEFLRQLLGQQLALPESPVGTRSMVATIRRGLEMLRKYDPMNSDFGLLALMRLSKQQIQCPRCGFTGEVHQFRSTETVDGSGASAGGE